VSIAPVLVVTGLLAPAAWAELPNAVELTTGHSRLLETAGIERVAIADPKVAEVRVIESTEQVLVIGRRPGSTDLRVWRSEGQSHTRVEVVAAPAATRDPTLAQLVERIPGVALSWLEGQPVLTGQPKDANAQQRLDKLKTVYSDIADLTRPAATPDRATVHFKARFVEIKRSTLRDLGLEWSDQSPGITFAYASDLHTNAVFRGDLGQPFAAGQLPLDIGQSNSYLGLGLDITGMINLLDESGRVEIIAEPMLSALSGSSAAFLAGGEIPIPVPGEGDATTVQFKDYGVSLEITPQVADDRTIRADVAVEVSSVDEAVTVMGVPGFSVRNATTRMKAQSGETLVIAGLVDSQQSQAVDRFPGLAELPVIGEFFRARRNRSEKTELVVMLTPSLKPWPETPEPRSDSVQNAADQDLLPLQEGVP
jgi:pilus assembly protein CpaC